MQKLTCQSTDSATHNAPHKFPSKLLLKYMKKYRVFPRFYLKSFVRALWWMSVNNGLLSPSLTVGHGGITTVNLQVWHICPGEIAFVSRCTKGDFFLALFTQIFYSISSWYTISYAYTCVCVIWTHGPQVTRDLVESLFDYKHTSLVNRFIFSFDRIVNKP